MITSYIAVRRSPHDKGPHPHPSSFQHSEFCWMNSSSLLVGIKSSSSSSLDQIFFLWPFLELSVRRKQLINLGIVNNYEVFIYVCPKLIVLFMTSDRYPTSCSIQPGSKVQASFYRPVHEMLHIAANTTHDSELTAACTSPKLRPI